MNIQSEFKDPMFSELRKLHKDDMTEACKGAESVINAVKESQVTPDEFDLVASLVKNTYGQDHNNLHFQVRTFALFIHSAIRAANAEKRVAELESKLQFSVKE